MSTKQITLMDKGQGQSQDQYQDLDQGLRLNHLPDQGPPPLQGQETAHLIQVHSSQAQRLNIQSV